MPKTFKMLPKWRIFAKSGHTGCRKKNFWIPSSNFSKNFIPKSANLIQLKSHLMVWTNAYFGPWWWWWSSSSSGPLTKRVRIPLKSTKNWVKKVFQLLHQPNGRLKWLPPYGLIIFFGSIFAFCKLANIYYPTLESYQIGFVLLVAWTNGLVSKVYSSIVTLGPLGA